VEIRENQHYEFMRRVKKWTNARINKIRKQTVNEINALEKERCSIDPGAKIQLPSRPINRRIAVVNIIDREILMREKIKDYAGKIQGKTKGNKSRQKAVLR